MTNRLIDQQINLPAEYQLPHPADIGDSPSTQLSGLEIRAIRILTELSNKVSQAKEKLLDAEAAADVVDMHSVDMMISQGTLPALPGVIKDVTSSPLTLAEKTQKYAEQGLQLVKMVTVPTGAMTAMTTMIYIDPKVTTLDEVKAHMLESAKTQAHSAVQAKQTRYEASKSLIEKFHKHYVQRKKQITSIADLFKAAKEI